MLSVAPASILILGVIGMLVVAFSVARMAVEERKVGRPLTVGDGAGSRQPVRHTRA